MNQAVPLSAVLATLACAVVVYLAYRLVKTFQESARRISESGTRLEIALGKLHEVLSTMQTSLAPAAEELKANMAGVPRLLEGVAKIGTAQLAIAREQQERERNPFGKRNATVPTRDPEAANQEYDIQQMMRSEGVSREEAMLRMNPANDQSVWANLTENWGGR